MRWRPCVTGLGSGPLAVVKCATRLSSVDEFRGSAGVPITSPRRSGTTCENAGQRSAQSSVDNCHSDDAVTNAAELDVWVPRASVGRVDNRSCATIWVQASRLGALVEADLLE
jgi:hypothetical protein